jgi:integrase
MASTHTRKDSSALQISAFIGGKRKAKSLHTDDPALAAKIGEKYNLIVSALSPEKRARQATLLGLVEELFIAADVPIPWDTSTASIPVSAVFDGYLARREKKISPGTFKMVSGTLEHFAEFTENPMVTAVTPLMIQGWYDALLTNVSAATANNRLTCVKSAFAYAHNMGLVASNPTSTVEAEEADDSSRLPLSDGDFKTLVSHLEVKGEREWTTAVMIARYTGLRMGDIMRLTGSNFHFPNDPFDREWLECMTSKGDKLVVIPLLGPLASYMRGLHLEADAPVCGELSTRRVASLSATFAALLVSAGIDTKERKLPNDRSQRLIGFHSLRHAFMSWLAAQNVPEDLRCLLGGHNARSHRGYVHQSASDLSKRLAEFGVVTETGLAAS